MKKTTAGGTKRVARPVPINRQSQPPTDFIALGSKPKDSRNVGSDNSSQYRMPPIKKPKMSSTPSHHMMMTPLSRLSVVESSTNRMSPTIPEPNVPCIDCPPEDIVYRVLKHLDANPDQVEGIVCGAIRNLRLHRIKPDATTVLSLLHLAKTHPAIFIKENVIESLCSLLKKDVGVDYIKSKTNNIVAIIACSILMKVLENENNWPSLIVQVFLDDSFAERIWVDHVDCQYFVKNIQTAFGTKLSQNIEKDDGIVNDVFSKEITLSRFESNIEIVQSLTLDLIKERLSRRQTEISVNSVGQGQAATGAALTGKYLIRTLTSACGLQDVRTAAVQKLEMWLQNPKLVKPTQDLLYAVCVNCHTHSQEDVDVIGSLTKLRLKSKLHLNQYLVSVKELIDAHPDNLKTMLSYVLYNELSNSRNQSNMAVVTSTLQNYPDAASKTLACVCQDLLLQQEDYLRAVRSLLREIVRSAKHEIRFPSLALGLMQEPDMEKYQQLDQTHKDRYIASTSDLICLTMLLSVTPQVKEAIHVINGKKKAADSFVTNPEAVTTKFKRIIAEIQHSALWWVHVIVIPQLNSSMPVSEYQQLIYKLLFLKPTDSYHTRDNWPPESERSFMIKACHDVPVLEDALLRVAAIGLSQEHPLSPAEALDLIHQLVRRAGALARPGANPIAAERVDFIDTILALCQYHHPGTIRLPSEYIPPSLAISLLYWTALQCLLVVIAFNPSTIGHQAWTQYPMLKVLMEMSIVNRFTYPPITLVDDDIKSQMVGKEQQMALIEKSEILEFESHLAAATTHLVVTEESSLLLSQLMALDPQGHPRRPPERILEQIGAISSHLQLGVWLCRSRQPDFLLEIINRHGENQSMSWLPDLVASTKGDVGLLPVQCVCEFLLVHDSEFEKLSTGGIHISELVSQLRRLLGGENIEEPLQVAQYFLKRLYSPQHMMRTRARKALALILSDSPEETMDHDQMTDTGFKWLLYDFVRTPHYASVIRPHAVEAVQSAALIDADPLCVIAYIRFLVNDLRQFEALNSEEELFEKSMNYARMVAQLLLDRRIIVDCAISLIDEKLIENDNTCAAEAFIASMLEILLAHIRQAQQYEMRRRINSQDANNDGMPWSDSQDEIYVRWPNNSGAATLHIFIPQASIILLGMGPPSRLLRKSSDASIDLQNDALYNDLMNLWFSEEGYVIPQAFLMDTQEEALLIPDWLRLRMLRSEVTPRTRRLAFAAVRDLEVDQIILFVQSFGIPVQSMNLLLEILDSQCESNSDIILNATSGNASYMAKLLDVQRMRGCKSGLVVSDLLKSNLDEPTKKATPSCVIDLLDDSSDSGMDVDATQDAPTVPQDANLIKDLLLKCFSGSDGNSSGWSSLLQAVNQVQRSTNHTASFCLEALHKIISSGKATEFIASLYHTPSRACCLLRAMDQALCSSRKNTNPKTLRKFKEIMVKIQQIGKALTEKLGGKSKCLYSLVTSWQNRHASTSKGVRSRRVSSTSEQSDNLRQSDWSRLEEFLRHQLAFLDKDEEIKAKVGLVAQILLEEISHRRTQMSLGRIHYTSACFTSIGTTGLLVDWLQLLDPELLAHTPTLQRKLLFESGRNDFSDFSTPVFDQAYLLSLLAEHCNWETIHSSLRWLLSDLTPDPTDEAASSQTSIAVDPKTALDFVWVVIQAPKIWQGRENKSTSVSEPVLQLTTAHFTRLLSYVVAATTNQKVSDDVSTEHGINYVDLFSIYFSKFCQAKKGKKHVCDIALFLRNKIKSASLFSPYTVIWWQLLAQLYILQPNIPVWDEMLKSSETKSGFSRTDLEKFSDTVTSITVGSDCQTDALVCSLLNRLGYVCSRSTGDTRVGSSIVMSSLDSAYDANLTLTKMASSRPFLILRQLPLLSAMLRGRTRHDFFEFKMQHHLPLMVNVIGIVQQLTPYVYREVHASYLFDIMEAFWQMIRNYCHRARRQMLPVLMKTLNLSQDYVSHSPADAAKILTKHQMTFQVLCRTYADQENVSSTVTGLQSTISSWMNNPNGGIGTTSVRPPFFSQSMVMGSSREKAMPLYAELIGENQDLENILQVLADFDESSKRRIDNIAPYISDLRRIFSQSRDPKARVLALTAALRHARNHPEDAIREIFPEYLSSLRELSDTDDRDAEETKPEKLLCHPFESRTNSYDSLSYSLLTDTATTSRNLLQFLPDVVVLCRENAVQLLGAAFDAGAQSKGALAYPKSISGDSQGNRNENSDVTNSLARSLWLLCGLDESDMKPKS